MDPDVERWRPLVERYFPAEGCGLRHDDHVGHLRRQSGCGERGGRTGRPVPTEHGEVDDTITAVRPSTLPRASNPLQHLGSEAQIATAALLVSQDGRRSQVCGWRNWTDGERLLPARAWKPGVTTGMASSM